MKDAKLQTANIKFDERGVPIATDFDDPYYSFSGGLDETRYVFLQGNDLPARLQAGFHIAEIGFGTGLNFFAAWQAWQGEGQIEFTSFEAFPMSATDRAQSLQAFPEIAALAQEFARGFNGTSFENDRIKLNVIIGDAGTTLPAWDDEADAWFLDGFSPAKNPDAWSENLLLEVGRHTKPSGTAATFTAAGHVRQKLSNAGFTVERIKGYGHKRHMTICKLPSQPR